LKRNWVALLTILIVATAWGATFTLVKAALSRIAPEPFIFWRFTLAGVILCAIALQQRQHLRPVAKAGIVLGLLVFIGYWLQTRGLMLITPSRSAFLTGLYVVMVPFCDRLIRGTSISAQAWIGSVLAVVGTTMLIGGLYARPSIGDLMTFACAVCFALHVVYSAEYTVRHPAIALAAVQVLFVGIAAGPPSLLAPRTAFRADVVVVIVFTAVVTTALAFVALMWGQARVSATEAAVILAVEPLAASFTSIIAGEERVTTAFVFAGGLILAGMVVSQLRR
jgi:drug/metabolite transporter (DMT)-like permease